MTTFASVDFVTRFSHTHFLLIFFPAGKTEDLKKELELDVHKVPLEELYKRFGSSENGLKKERAAANLAEYGPNALTPPPTTPEWVKFCQNLFGGASAIFSVF